MEQPAENSEPTPVVNRYVFPCPIGTKPKYANPQELTKHIVDYFQVCMSTVMPNNKPKPPTLAGLSLHLGFANRQSLYDYEKKNKGKEQYSCVIKSARTAIEDYVESGILSGFLAAIPGIFSLKNHHGYVDKQEIVVETPTYGEIEDEGQAIADERVKLQKLLLEAGE